MKKTNIKVSGMHCQSCVTIISRALAKEKGIKSANVNFSTEKAMIGFDPKVISLNKILEVIKKKGYSGSLAEGKDLKKEERDRKRELAGLKFKVLLSSVFAFPAPLPIPLTVESIQVTPFSTAFFILF